MRFSKELPVLIVIPFEGLNGLYFFPGGFFLVYMLFALLVWSFVRSAIVSMPQTGLVMPY